MKYLISMILMLGTISPCLAQDKKLSKGDFNLLVSASQDDPMQLILNRLDQLERKVDRVTMGNKPQFLKSTDGGPQWILGADGEYYRNEREYVAPVSNNTSCQPVMTYQQPTTFYYQAPPVANFGFGGGGGGDCSGGS
jgi:hypothetical protein